MGMKLISELGRGASVVRWELAGQSVDGRGLESSGRGLLRMFANRSGRSNEAGVTLGRKSELGVVDSHR